MIDLPAKPMNNSYEFRNIMQIPLSSVQDAGVAIRTMRKRAGIRIDDFALTAGVSKQFMTDLENGKPSVQMGMVLSLLQRLNLRVSLDLPDTSIDTFRTESRKVDSRRAKKVASKSFDTDVHLKERSATGESSND
jgi:transcriptional regulator with XRE-family HTH domain